MNKSERIGLGIVAGQVAYFVAAAVYGFDPMRPLALIITAIPILMLLAIPACLFLAFVLSAFRGIPFLGMILLAGIAVASLLQSLKEYIYAY